ncbi:SDR family NAD(P)-dependent oxidoreductase [Legionella cincinnatiensis]|uniref:Acetyoacetyl CoA reductase n=1 Tax=Legionella cincinnatiensis TaxID=28085 RepID=A0A378IK56_9GAMM|nr:SDR family oxidoreductase [Legionella cincinnatiensis]KTC93946.1 acetyoacetyl CoA reductase [Legionella cincinnatiensis]STX35152.1 acetyoacetyl CoA reductase [Legionella cincinnatiensis]
MAKLKNKIALITGGTKSIGLSIAESFCKKGATVIVTGRLSKPEGEKFAQSIGASDYLHLDVCSEQNWQEVAEYIENKYHRLDILVNNAGIDSAPKSDKPQDIENCSLDDWRVVHAVNLDGTFLGCKTMMPLLKKSANASIINMGSRSGLVGIPSNAAYASSKAAILNLTRTVAMHCAQKDYPIRCNVIVPAAILTEMWNSEFGQDEERTQRIEAYTNTIPLKRMGQASEVANLAVFLASDDSLFITGSQYNIDGGIMAGNGSYGSNKNSSMHRFFGLPKMGLIEEKTSSSQLSFPSIEQSENQNSL